MVLSGALTRPHSYFLLPWLPSVDSHKKHTCPWFYLRILSLYNIIADHANTQTISVNSDDTNELMKSPPTIFAPSHVSANFIENLQPRSHVVGRDSFGTRYDLATETRADGLKDDIASLIATTHQEFRCLLSRSMLSFDHQSTSLAASRLESLGHIRSTLDIGS